MVHQIVREYWRGKKIRGSRCCPKSDIHLWYLKAKTTKKKKCKKTNKCFRLASKTPLTKQHTYLVSSIWVFLDREAQKRQTKIKKSREDADGSQNDLTLQRNSRSVDRPNLLPETGSISQLCETAKPRARVCVWVGGLVGWSFTTSEEVVRLLFSRDPQGLDWLAVMVVR